MGTTEHQHDERSQRVVQKLNRTKRKMVSRFPILANCVKNQELLWILMRHNWEKLSGKHLN